MTRPISLGFIALTLALTLGCGAHSAVIPSNEVPANVMAGFTKAFPDASIEKVEKETYRDGTIHYEFEYKTKDGKEHEVELNDEGAVLDKH